MANAAEQFGALVDRAAPKHPVLARELLLTGYRAFGWKLRHRPDPGLPPSRQYLATVCNRASVSTLARPAEAALVSVFLPCELLHAAGIRPMCAELYSAFLNGAWAERYFAQAAEDAGIAETFCSYHKILMGGALSGVLPRPGCVVNCSLACDANNLSFRALAEHFGIAQYYVDVPPRQGEESVAYVAQQLRGMAAFLEKETGRRIEEAALRAALERSRRTLENFRACVPLKRERYLATDMTSEMYEIYTTHIGLGSPEAERYSRMLLEDWQAAGPKRGIRLLWIHTMPNWQQPLREVLTCSERCQVVACDINFENLAELDPDRPYESMARRLVNSTFGGGAGRRIAAAEDMARALDVDGAVCFCHWGCKETMGASVLMKQALDAAGFPTLILNGDGCDRGNSSDGQVATRMNAFLEMLERGKR